jgi:triose/dihydroxyacetone kinase / FAD-AMP lyase (cyclizing)
MFTFGVSMDSCSLPGKPKSHDLAADEIEIGMGIHGEKGREKVKWMQASQLVA